MFYRVYWTEIRFYIYYFCKKDILLIQLSKDTRKLYMNYRNVHAINHFLLFLILISYYLLYGHNHIVSVTRRQKEDRQNYEKANNK